MRAAAVSYSLRDKKKGVFALPFVVLTSIKRSRPAGSNERMSYPAPSPSLASDPPNPMGEIGPLHFRELAPFQFQNEELAGEPERPVAAVPLHRVKFANKPLKLPWAGVFDGEGRGVDEGRLVVGLGDGRCRRQCQKVWVTGEERSIAPNMAAW